MGMPVKTLWEEGEVREGVGGQGGQDWRVPPGLPHLPAAPHQPPGQMPHQQHQPFRPPMGGIASPRPGPRHPPPLNATRSLRTQEHFPFVSFG